MERGPIDAFIAFWTGLESINPLLQEKHQLEADRVEKICPKCQTGVVLEKSNSGTHYALDAVDGTAWREVNGVRNDLLHSRKATNVIAPSIAASTPKLEEALRLSLLDLGGLSPEAAIQIKRSPMGIPDLPKAKIRFVLRHASRDR